MNSIMTSQKMASSFTHRMSSYVAQVNDMLEAIVTDPQAKSGSVSEAMLYSIQAGGKRIRPILMLEFCRICGGSVDYALPIACSLEFIHTYSLIHDDLPCMDDDDYRRGQPSCHKRFGDATALLAGDALLTLSFEMLARVVLDPQVSVACVAELAKASGVRGMIGGQEIDLASANQTMTEQELARLHQLKTGELIRAACRMGCLAAKASPKQLEVATKYAEKLGLAFQIVDDILDVEGDAEILGKPVGSDQSIGKTTYVTLLGLEQAKARARALTDEALSLLQEFEDNAFLTELTKSLLARQN